MKRTIGGDRLGSGKKMKVALKNYERSTHDLSYAFRTSMAPGTLVPFLVKPIGPGSTWDIDLEAIANTHPTIGPLYGSFKLQLDVFIAPMRCYIARLHNNESGLGRDMENVLFPLIEKNGWWDNDWINDKDVNIKQINPSSILSYLGINGIGRTLSGTTGGLGRRFNGIPYLAYWEIYKNYYANQQEEIGAYITRENAIQTIFVNASNGGGTNTDLSEELSDTTQWVGTAGLTIDISTANTNPADVDINAYEIYTSNNGATKKLHEMFYEVWKYVSGGTVKIAARDTKLTAPIPIFGFKMTLENTQPTVGTFELSNIDNMKRRILQQPYTSPLIITETAEAPYGRVLRADGTNQEYASTYPMEGLALKTYQNDLFNNWLNTEWIDGSNGVNQISAVQIVDNKLTIPSLILARKVFNVLNRIAISGGTYDDWLEVTYDHERVKRWESPAYMGGLIKEIVFEEVVSQSQAETQTGEQPLGTLGGRGTMSSKHKGGKMTIKTDEWAYVIGIVSITPRIDYSQGNQWDVNIRNMNELHKPEMDEIGFQDLITDQLAWWDTRTEWGGDLPTYKSAGKQPAWINYMTSVNTTKGNFAITDSQMWMTLNRRYEINSGGIADLTSYIDPVKFNQIFADTRLDAQNFWINIGVGIEARQKMSAKIMPNL